MDADENVEEKPGAVRLMRRLDRLADLATAGPVRRFLRHVAGRDAWPGVSGVYRTGEPDGPVAVCTLTSMDLILPTASVPGVAIAGRVYTANLGIEKIVRNVTDNPHIRFLLLCGKESPVFHPGQSLRSLWVHGVTPEKRIIGALGHFPMLNNTRTACIECFRHQVELVDCTGEVDISTLSSQIFELVLRDPGPYPQECEEEDAVLRLGAEEDWEGFVTIQPGGRREPLAYDPKGFFIITVDRSMGNIVTRHYLPDHTPAHIVRGRTAEAVLLALVREGLISQTSHAGYLGAELAKAETAIRLNLRYEQDQPLRGKKGIE